MKRIIISTYARNWPVVAIKQRGKHLELSIHDERIKHPTNEDVRRFAGYDRNSLTQAQRTLHYYINFRAERKAWWGPMLYYDNNKYTKKHYSFPFNTRPWSGGTRLS